MRTFWLLTKHTFQQYSADGCSLMAAGISYYVLFSIVPLAIFLVSVFGLVVRGESRRDDVSNSIVDFLQLDAGKAALAPDAAAIDARYGPGAADEVRRAIAGLTKDETEEAATSLDGGGRAVIAGRALTAQDVTVSHENIVTDTLRSVSRVSPALGVAGLLGVLWAASAMFGAVRRSLNVVWGVESPRPVVQQKLWELAMVAGLGLLLSASVAGTGALRALRELSDKQLGPLSEGTGPFWSVVPFFFPAITTFVVFFLLYRYVPNASTSARTIWPGALLATVLFETLKNGFAFYVAKFNNFDVAYGSLGGLLLFLLWTYLSASILLLGAELAGEYARAARGEYAQLTIGGGRTIPQQVRRYVRGLFLPHRD